MKFDHVKRIGSLATLFLASTALAFGQVGSLNGKVTDGEEPVKDALIKITRTDIKGNYKVKTKKKGEWFHAGLPIGTYDVALEIDGTVIDRVIGVRVGLGDPTPVNFDIAEARRRQQAAAGGQQEPPPEVIKSMSEEERKQYEESIKKRQQQLSKNKELNEAFNLGMSAKQAKDWPTAITNLEKAAAIDAEQDVIWANLADSQSALADAKAGPERKELLTAAAESYRKAIALKPDAAAYYNNLGLALVKSGDLDGGREQLSKAAELDPANGGRYFFNLGAVMINSGNTEAAITAFRRATEVQPDYADAYYQLATAMVGSAKVNDDGSVDPVPGTVEAFQKYLELKPGGPYAESAQMMISSLTGGVETTFESPDAKKKKK